MKRFILPVVPCLLLTVACGTPEDDPVGTGGDYDEALLEAYLRAIPSASMLEAPVPDSTMSEKGVADVGDPAMFPQHAVPIARNINQTVKALLDTLESVVQYPPSAYNSETREFVWGPFENSASAVEGDTVYLYIRDQGEGADFRYVYAWLRGVSNDVSTMTPVIWGGQNPDPDNEDYGDGVALWDYEANHAWMAEHYPDEPAARGRFVARFARGLSEDNPDHEVTVVVAVFRDFVSEGADPGTEPEDLDYFWGNVFDGTNELDFLDLEYQEDLQGTSSSAEEDFGMRLAFYNSGVGRAEADVTGGDLPTDIPGYILESAECWDAALARTYYDVIAVPEDPASEQPEYVVQMEGAAENCALESLDSIPSLDDLDPTFLQALDDLASNGVPQE